MNYVIELLYKFLKRIVKTHVQLVNDHTLVSLFINYFYPIYHDYLKYTNNLFVHI